MVPLPESFKAFMYQGNVDRVRVAYRASAATMESVSQAAREAAARYEASGEDDAEYDEDGATIFSTRHSLDYAAMEAGLAVTVVREAFITSAFHLWETSARGWTGLHKPGQTFDLLSAASDKHYPISPNLRHLNTLNNYIKHRNPAKAALLAIDRPDYFHTYFGRQWGPDRPPHLRITHEHVEEAFETISVSGPQFSDTPGALPTWS